MAVLANLPADARNLSENIGCNIRAARDMALLTDTTVAAADTNAGLQAAVMAAFGPADINQARYRICNAIQLGLYSGELTDARILDVATVAELIALTADASTDERRQHMAC